jgi:hypothetical protein
MYNEFTLVTPELDEHYTWLADELSELEEMATELDMYGDFAMEWEFE